MAASLEIGADDIEQLVGCFAVQGTRMLFSINQMGVDVILNHLDHETGEATPCTGNQVHDFFATGFVLQSPFNRFDLTAQSADTGEELAFFVNGVCHVDNYSIAPHPIKAGKRRSI